MAGDRRSTPPELIAPPTLAPPGGHYSHAVVANGMVYVAGQLPITPEGVKLGDAPFEVQARQALANVKGALEAAGSRIDRLVHVRVYLDDLEQWAAFNTLYVAWVGSHRPARAVVPVPALHYGLKIEIEAIAQRVD